MTQTTSNKMKNEVQLLDRPRHEFKSGKTSNYKKNEKLNACPQVGNIWYLDQELFTGDKGLNPGITGIHLLVLSLVSWLRSRGTVFGHFCNPGQLTQAQTNYDNLFSHFDSLW